MEPLTGPYWSTILDFGELGNLESHPVEKQGAPGWAHGPGGQILLGTCYPLSKGCTPHQPCQGSLKRGGRWESRWEVPTAARLTGWAAGTSPRLRAKRKWRKDLQVPDATEEQGCHPVKKRAGALWFAYDFAKIYTRSVALHRKQLHHQCISSSPMHSVQPDKYTVIFWKRKWRSRVLCRMHTCLGESSEEANKVQDPDEAHWLATLANLVRAQIHTPFLALPPHWVVSQGPTHKSKSRARKNTYRDALTKRP